MKERLIALILEKLAQDLTVTRSAAEAAHKAATGEENKPENEYDTRGLEASYLAGAQMKRAAEIEKQIAFYKALQSAPQSGSGAQVQVGTLLQALQKPNRRAFFLLATEGGGTTVEVDGVTVNVITPQSPLGEALLGSAAGETAEYENAGVLREVLIQRIL